MALTFSTDLTSVGGITMTRAGALDYARRDAEHRKKYPTPAGGYFEVFGKLPRNPLRGTGWIESSSSSTYVVFDGQRVVSVFEGNDAQRRAGEYVGNFGGTRYPAIRVR